ncbi:uncharacterized protein LOC134778627 [Penaeus indicus]|uniref:uncharacterized protein LOC134778627 n=1 Tax=Penaeus indicus TaxID=29960 RepID=UPI00300CB77F
MEVTRMLTVAGVGMLLALVLASAHYDNGHKTGQFDPAAMCTNSTDSGECLRRVEVCRNMHRESNRRERMVQTIINCAQQLDIKTLPSFDSPQDPSESSYTRFRAWMRAHPEEKRRLFACAHQGLFTPDGNPNRTALVDRVLAVLGDEERELRTAIVNSIKTCPANTRREYFRCVFMACVTP